MLYFIGLGLADEKDITVKGLEIVQQAERVYLEAYTAVLLVEKEKLELFYGRPVILADRELVESSSDSILADADKKDIAFLVVGDPFGATTHTDLLLRARHLHIPTQTLPNASILTGIGSTGLSLYNFGQTLSMVFFTQTWRPTSFYPRLVENAKIGLHTLVLLDIKVKEPDYDVLTRTGKVRYLPPRYMTVARAARQMIEVEGGGEGGESVCGKDVLAVGVARVGAGDMKIVAGTLGELGRTLPRGDDVAGAEEEDEEGEGDKDNGTDLGPPLHSLVIIGRRGHDLERDFLEEFAVNKARFVEIWNRDYGKQV
ncbi:diphthine synthase [Venturia nashicola]|uniref:diphthine methyl ester synthase n=1 Tax=Venturia nashicola TaxID=86259 RepID=A0A4Z1P3B0_9PEZI|nr:diphthine synthase [Venturia nashicola]TLD35338.1 diphthine synthase [Venturia nashicola]